MKRAQIAYLLMIIFVIQPMWFFLLYSILCAIHPDRLVWFLYWAYVPASVTGSIVASIAFKDSQ